MRRHNETMTSALFTIALVFVSLVSSTLLDNVPPTDTQAYISSSKQTGSPGKLEYRLSEGNDTPDKKATNLLSYLSSFLLKSRLIENIVHYFGSPSNNANGSPALIHGVPSKTLRSQDVPIMAQRDPERMKFEASLSYDAPPRSVPVGNGHQLRDEAWADTLFGPAGVLTAIFHVMDDRRKDSLPRQKGSQESKSDPKYEEELKKFYASRGNKTQSQADLLSFPDFLNNAKPVDLAKIFGSFLTSSGDFEDPIAELPEFLGICNRLSCGDIYKAIDQFRKSDFFTNFQTALQLIQDPKGWEILGDLLSNPELISQFTGGSGLDKFFGSGLTEVKKNISKRPSTEIGPEDGNLGTDFSSMVNERKPPKEAKPSEFELPEIAENVDYYSAVEHGEDGDGPNGGTETVMKPEETIAIPEVDKTTDQLEISLPEISESIDENVEAVTKIDIVPARTLPKPDLYTGFNSTSQRITKMPSTVNPPRTTAGTPKPSTGRHLPSPSQQMTRRTTPSPPTTRNFRKDNDYYAMYYDS